MRTGRGFSVIELLIVTVVLGVLLTIGIMALPRHGFAVNQAATGLARSVQLARFEAIRQNTFVGLRVSAEQNGYEFFTGRAYSEAAVFRDVLFGDQSTPGVRITRVEPTEDVVFDPRGMRIAPSGKIDVTLTAGDQQRIVEITQHGRTSIQ